jgi:hypothetical protein
MEHRRQPVRIAEPIHQRADRLQPEPPLRQRQRRQAIELGLNARVVGLAKSSKGRSGGLGRLR